MLFTTESSIYFKGFKSPGKEVLVSIVSCQKAGIDGFRVFFVVESLCDCGSLLLT